MNLTSHLPDWRRDHVESRLCGNLMAWLTTVRPDGRPDSVPVWFFLREDETIVLFSEPGKLKLRNIAHNPRVSLGLDVTDLGRDIIRIDGTARRDDDHAVASAMPGFVTKYTERIAAVFGTIEQYAQSYSVPVIVTPTRLHA